MPSLLSLAAIVLYLLVAACLAFAAAAARRHRQQPWHVKSWLLLLAFFILLIIMRAFSVEDQLRDQWRGILAAAGEYQNRRHWQRMVLVVILVGAATVGGWLAYRSFRKIRGRRNFAVATALAGALGMLFLMSLRWLSLHVIDGFLYGPLKLNWIGDIGISLGTAAAAIYYARVVGGRQ